MKPIYLPVVRLAWCLSLALCFCCAHAQDAATPAAPIAAPASPPVPVADLRKRAEDMKLKDPRESAALYAQLVASDTTPAERATDLDNQAEQCLRVFDWKTAESLARQALELHQQASDSSGEGKSLRIIARALYKQGKDQQVISLCESALVFDRTAHSENEEANALRVESNEYRVSNHDDKFLDANRQARSIYRQIGDRDGEAYNLLDMGVYYEGSTRYSKAIANFSHALLLFRSMDDTNGAANTFNDIGVVYLDLSQFTKAMDNFKQSLALYESSGDQEGTIGALIDLGDICLNMSRYSQTIMYCTRAAAIAKSLKDEHEEAGAMTNMAVAYNDLGQYSKAIEDFEYVLPIFRSDNSIGSRDGEATTLTDLGDTYLTLGRYTEAISDLAQAVPIFHNLTDEDGEASALNGLAIGSKDLGRYSQAIDYSTQALPLFRHVGDKDGEADAVDNIGDAWEDGERYSKSLNDYTQALPIYRSIGDRNGAAVTLVDMMENFSAKKNPSRNPRLAIYYGKRFVNTVQSIRRANASLDKTSLDALVASKAGGYRHLADLLIQQGRLPEAQKVLRLLKDQEFYDFLHVQGGNDDNIAPAESLALTPREKRWSDAYDATSEHLGELQSQSDALNRIAVPTPANKAKMASLNRRINAADASITTLLAKTVKSFAEPVSQQDRLPDTAIAGDVAAALKPGEAALYTIVSPDRLDLILILPPKRGHAEPPKVYSSPIKQTDLYTQVYRLRTALTDTQVDPRPLAAPLYDLVLRPVKRDLVAAHVKTILFSLDDALRYIPPAALYDNETKRYVVQDYATALITLAGKPAAAKNTALAPEIIGAGVSQSPGSTDPPLPGVKKELDGIVHQAGDAAGSGLYPGTRMLDDRFTRAALEGSLATHRYPMVHLASHFLLHATDADSYLLLGDGTQLSVQDIRQDPKRFADVDLLTLSACDTAMEVKSSTGREVEGLGALAQSLGAKAVLASLWPVSDTETPKLMIAFYAYHKAYPRVALPEALRQAQLSLLEGKGTSASEAGGSARGTMMVGVVDPKWHSFKASASAPDAHSYYWAPFVLLGDWK